MNKTHKNAILIIIVSAILVATVFNIKTVLFILEELETKSLLDFTERSMIKVYIGLFAFFFHMLIFYITALFNYSWKEKLIPKQMVTAVRVMLIVIFNVLIFYIFALIEPKLLHLFFTGIYNWGTNLSLSDQQQYQQLLSGIGQWFNPVYFIFINFTIVTLAAAEAYFIILLRKIKTAELENIRLREEKSNAELAALKEQISPHFFFNTLNTLSSVIRTERKSDSLEFVDSLSRVYRYILESNRHDLVKLKDEIGFLNAYFFLLGKRFEKKLLLEIDIAPDLLETSMPPMSIQLLVENALQHNTITRSKPLKIQIYDENNMICVQNNLHKKKSSESMGIGLPNLLKRYQLIAKRDIIIHKNTEFFTVKLPVIK